jgi:hypothetical protein
MKFAIAAAIVTFAAIFFLTALNDGYGWLGSIRRWWAVLTAPTRMRDD